MPCHSKNLFFDPPPGSYVFPVSRARLTSSAAITAMASVSVHTVDMPASCSCRTPCAYCNIVPT